jgi:hypothetical protein
VDSFLFITLWASGSSLEKRILVTCGVLKT